MDTAQQMTLAEAAAADLPADFKVGHIISVTGSKVTATLVSANDAAAAGELNRAVQIGSLVKMPTAESVAFGIVSALSTGNPSPSPEFGEQWVVEIDLFGEYLTQDAAAQPAGGLHLLRGVSHYPGLGEGVYATASKELREIYKRPRSEEHTSELQSLMRNSYAVFCLKQ